MADKGPAPGKGRRETGKPDIKTAGDDRKLQHRRLYLAGRIASLRDELKAITDERKTIDGKLKGMPEGAEQKKLRQRRIYVVERPLSLRTELSAAAAEMKELMGKLRGAAA
jgi:hypothetical protein